MKLNLAWKIVVDCRGSGVDYSMQNKCFNVRSSKSFLKRIGGILGLNFFPHTLEPTNVFYNLISPYAQENGFNGRKLPYNFSSMLQTGVSNRLKINFHCYSKHVVIISCSIDPIEFIGSSDELLKLIQLKNNPSIYKLVLVLCGILRSGGSNSVPISYTPKSYPVISLESDNVFLEIPDNIAVEILTRHKNVRSAIVDSVISKNKDHQLDGNSFLVDRQGILARYVNNQDSYDNSKRKFESLHCLLELAIAISSIIENDDLTIFSQHEQDAIKNLVRTPEIVFTKSVTAYNTWVLLVAEFNLLSRYKSMLQVDFNNEDNNSEETEKNQWSDSKNWFMGIVATVLVVFTSWFGTFIYDNYNPFSAQNIKEMSPEDGFLFNKKDLSVEFKWKDIEESDRYILSIEKYDADKDKWSVSGRFVTKKSRHSEVGISDGRYRWKVESISKDDEVNGNSIWYFFTIRHSESAK